MADSKLLTQDEMALRRRARRRLVGAVAIALTAVLVLPMVFDPEPKPLGPEVDIRIPSRDTPFVAAPAAPARGCAGCAAGPRRQRADTPGGGTDFAARQACRRAHGQVAPRRSEATAERAGGR
jgi:hypothetical protein